MISAKVFTLALLCLSAASGQNNPNGGIRFFEGTLKEALAKAKKEGKFVFFDAYASWCGPCKTMENEVFTDSAVGAYFNEKFDTNFSL